MRKLINGIIDFRKNSLQQYRQKFSKLAKTQQRPDALLIACCDSRVVPNVFASSDPGDVFVMRNIGNLIPPYHDFDKDNLNDDSVAATVEFALTCLHVKYIIICGHSECGAMQALTDHLPEDGLQHLHSWLDHAKPAFDCFKQQPKHPSLPPHDHLSRVNVLQQIQHVCSYPSVQAGLKNGTLRIHGWWFDLATADVYYYDQEVGDFLVIDEEHAEKLLKKGEGVGGKG